MTDEPPPPVLTGLRMAQAVLADAMNDEGHIALPADVQVLPVPTEEGKAVMVVVVDADPGHAIAFWLDETRAVYLRDMLARIFPPTPYMEK